MWAELWVSLNCFTIFLHTWKVFMNSVCVYPSVCRVLTHVLIIELPLNWYMLLYIAIASSALKMKCNHLLFAYRDTQMNKGFIMVYGKKSFEMYFNNVTLFQILWSWYTSLRRTTKCFLYIMIMMWKVLIVRLQGY